MFVYPHSLAPSGNVDRSDDSNALPDVRQRGFFIFNHRILYLVNMDDIHGDLPKTLLQFTTHCV